MSWNTKQNKLFLFNHKNFWSFIFSPKKKLFKKSYKPINDKSSHVTIICKVLKCESKLHVNYEKNNKENLLK